MSSFPEQLQQEELDDLYAWVDQAQLSRPKKNISRDFSDALMMAELVALYRPGLVSLHNYPTTNSVSAKTENWTTLNTKVLNKLGINLPKQIIKDLANSVPFAIERVLLTFKQKVDQVRQNYSPQGQQPEEEFRESPGKSSVQRLSRADELREVLRLIQNKIQSVQKSIRRKDEHIRDLETAIKQYS